MIAVLLVNHLGDRADGLAPVNESQRLDAALGETYSNSLADAATGSGDHSNLSLYIHIGIHFFWPPKKENPQSLPDLRIVSGIQCQSLR